MAIAEPETEGETTVPPDAKAQPPLLEFRMPILVIARGRTGGNRSSRRDRRRWEGVIGPVQGHCRRILMAPERREGIHVERFEGEGLEHLVQVWGKQRSEQLAEAISIQGRALEPGLQAWQHATLCQPLSSLVQRLRPSQEGKPAGFYPPTARHNVVGMGRKPLVAHRRHLQLSPQA
jgi:hypothetical protein